MIPPWYVRLRCRLLGHRWVGEHREAQVIPLFIACRSCGKWERLAVNNAIQRAPRSPR